MKKLYVFVVLLLQFYCIQLHAQLVNDGAVLYLNTNSLLYVGQNYTHNNGLIVNNGEMVVNGNWFNNNINSRVIDRSSTGINSFTGGAVQIAGNGATLFPQLVFVGNGTVALGVNTETRLLLNLADREVITSNYAISLSATDQNSLITNTGFINTNGGGIFTRKTNNTVAYLFPLGSSFPRLMRPVTVTPKDNQANTYSLALIALDPNSSGYSRLNKRAEVTDINEKYYFKLSQDAGSSNTDFGFYTATADGDYNGVVSWLSNRIWEKAGLVRSQDGSYFNGTLNRLITYSHFNSNNSISLQGPLMNTPFDLAKVSDLSDPLVIFNAFSPDGDGKNDRWEIRNIGGFPDNDLKIYDRSGNTVFKASGYSNIVAWDGANSPPGTYFYVLRVKINSEDKYYKGSITLIKN